MGLNIGIYVRAPLDHHSRYGDLILPDVPDDVLEQRFFTFLRERFPDAAHTFGGGWVRRKIATQDSYHGDGDGALWFDFDVRPYQRGAAFEATGRPLAELFAGIFAFVLDVWPLYDGELTMEVYSSP